MGSKSVLSGIRHLSASPVKLTDLCPAIQSFVNEQVKVCQPDKVYVCDGSEEENHAVIQQLIDDGRLVQLSKYNNW